jgi:hypothetical protein
LYYFIIVFKHQPIILLILDVLNRSSSSFFFDGLACCFALLSLDRINYNYGMRAIRFISIFSIVLLMSCHQSTPEPRSREELINYVNRDTNGLIQHVQLDDFIVTAVYQPKGLAPKCAACDEYAYFIVKIKHADARKNEQFLDSHAFPESIETFAFRMGDYVKLIAAQDTIAPADYTFQRTFGLDNQGSFLFVFPKKPIESAKKISLLVKSNGLITDDVNLDFNTEDLLNTQRFILQ